MIEEVGVAGLTIEGVASRSGVGKASIYRRYRGKEDLALATLQEWRDRVRSPRDLGDTRAELEEFVATALDLLRSPLINAIVGVVPELVGNAELGRRYRELIVDPRMNDLAQVVARAVARGDLRPDTDIRRAHELLIGPIWYRLIFSGAPLDEELPAGLADSVLRVFGVEV